MDLLVSFRILLLVIVTMLYASFDLFNKRNVPDVFAYASVILGLAVTLVYSSNLLVYSLLLALFIGALGYAIYRLGFWGAGDYFELVAVSLLFPMQSVPIMSSVNQLGLPFILSVFISTGFVAVWIVPIYYLFFVKKGGVEPKLDPKHVTYGIVLLALYISLFLITFYFYGFKLGRLVLVLLVAVPSAITLVYENRITARMIKLIRPRELEEGDIIATNLMSKSAVKRFSEKYSGFGRLATKTLIKEVRNVKEKLPVYVNAAPLAPFVLVGVIISLLFGNIILFMV